MPSQAVVMMEIPQDGGPKPLGELLEFAPAGNLFLTIVVLSAVFHIGMALFVFADARKRRTELMPAPAPAPAWALVVLCAGLIGLLVYWVVNQDGRRSRSGGAER